MDVRMPDGTIVSGVPNDITQSELLRRYSLFKRPEEQSNKMAVEDNALYADATNPLQGIQQVAPPQAVEQVKAPNVMSGEDYLREVAKREQQNPSRSMSDYAKDAGITFLKSAIGLPESFVGLADIPTLGKVGKILENVGYKPAEAKEILDSYLSEAQQAANRKVSNAKGFLPTIQASLENPSTIATSIAESLPQMVGSAGVARGVLKSAPTVAPYIAGAIGEGVLGAGQSAEQTREQSDTGLLTAKQSAAAVGSGIGTGVIGAAAGRLADKLGLENINTLLAGKTARTKAESIKDFIKKSAASGVTEGVFEELPQSAQEQMWLNYAQDKPIMEGVAEAAGTGLVAGVAMGAVGAGFGSHAYPQSKAEEAQQTTTPTQPVVQPTAPVQPITPPPAQPTPPVTPSVQEEHAQDREEMMRELGLLPEKKEEPKAEEAKVEPKVEVPVEKPVEAPKVEEPKAEEQLTPGQAAQEKIVESEKPVETKEPITVASEKKTNNKFGNPITEIKLSDGSTHQIVRLNSLESNGLPGWHDDNHEGLGLLGWLGSNKEEAVKKLIEKQNNNLDKPVAEQAEPEKPAEVTTPEEPKDVENTYVQQHLDAFKKGNFGLSQNAISGANPQGREIAKSHNIVNEQAYDVAAKQFLEGPLDTKPPTVKQSKLEIGRLTNISPNPIKKSVGKIANNFDEVRKAMHTIAGRDDPRLYINGLHINEKDKELVATDGHRLALLKDIKPENLPEKPKDLPAASSLTKDNVWKVGYPDYTKVIPKGHGDTIVEINSKEMENIAEIARGIAKAGKYLEYQMAPMPIMIGDKTLSFNAKYIVDAMDLTRKLGFQKAQLSFSATGKIGQDKLFLTSTDGKLKQVVMPVNKPGNNFKTLELGEVKKPAKAARAPAKAEVNEEEKIVDAIKDMAYDKNSWRSNRKHTVKDFTDKYGKPMFNKAVEMGLLDNKEATERLFPSNKYAYDVSQKYYGSDGKKLKATPAKAEPKEEPKAKTEVSTEVTQTSNAYDQALEDSRQAYREFQKFQEDYRAGKIGDDEFLAARKQYDAAMSAFDKAYDAELERSGEKIEYDDPNIIDGTDLIKDMGHEKQLLMIADASSQLSNAESAVLEKEYGHKRGTNEFLDKLHKDVINFVTNGANAIKVKLRPIINKIANGMLSVVMVFNPNFVSPPVNIVIPAYKTVTKVVTQEPPKEAAQNMSAQARRAYEVLYPSLKDELIKSDKLFLVVDKPTATQFIFNPDGSLLLQSKILLAKGIGDFEKGDNNIDANKITPAGVRTLVRRSHTSSTEGYDFDTVFGTMGVNEETGGKYFSTVYHSVYTHLNDAQKRLKALKEPGPANSRYSFGCINVDKDTFKNLLQEHTNQMDGATLFVVPDNDKNVMNFINGKATEEKDIIRRKVEPVTEKVKVPVNNVNENQIAKNTTGKPEDDREYLNIIPIVESEKKKRNPSFVRRVTQANKMRLDGRLSNEAFINEIDNATKQKEALKYEKGGAERVRGEHIIREKINNAVRNGYLTDESRKLAEFFINQNPSLVDDLGISVKSSEAGVGGFYNAMGRIMVLMKDSGSDTTAVHEMLHHTERMMPNDIQDSIRKEWLKQLFKAQDNAKTDAEKIFFKVLLDAQFGDNNPLAINLDPKLNKLFFSTMEKAILSKAQPGERISSGTLAKYMLQSSMLPMSNYQFTNPSEFWAVNGSRIVEGDYNAIQKGTLAKLKNWLGKLLEKLKSMFGLKSDAPIIKALESLKNSDGKFQSAEMIGAGMKFESIQNYKNQPAPAASFDSPDETKMDSFLRAIQDKHIDTKRIIESIQKTGKQIDEAWNPYLKEELYHGRTADQIKNSLDKELLPIVKEMDKEKIKIDELDKYLHNRHAKERNYEIAKINPAFPDGGSGLTDQKVDDYFKNLDPKIKTKLESIANKIDSFIRGTQDILVNGGLETQDTIDLWNKIYQHYVPLQRSEEELDFVNHGSGLGKGYSTKGGASKRAVGSAKTVADVFENIALQRERAIIRSEKARVGKALYGMALQFPNVDFWLAVNPDAIKNKKKLYEELTSLGLSPSVAANIIQEPKVATIDPMTGLVRYQVNPALRNSDNVFPVRINGKDRYIFFNNKDERAQNMVKAMKNLDSEQLGIVLGTVGEATRWMASVNTQYNPVFGAWNFARDVSSAAFNLTTTPIADKKAEVMMGVFPAMFAIYGDLRGKNQTPVWSDMNKRFLEAGGATGYSEQFSRGRSKITGEREKGMMQKQLDKLNQGSARKKAQYVFDLLSDYNDAMENAVRLSAFKVGLDNGMSEDMAASMAKNLTVNFNRKGSMSPTFQSLYAFFNPSVQGTARLMETLQGPAGKKIIAGGITLGVLQAIALGLAGYDDDEPPEYLKDKNFIIPVGNNYLIWPYPPGFSVLPGISRIATEYMLGKMGLITGSKDIGHKVTQILGLVVDSFNPLGGNSLWQAITPTVIDPIASIYMNKDAFGRPISKEDRSTNPTPGYTRSRDGANAIAQGLAEFFNFASGGTKDVKGAISPTADQITYLAGQYTGGLGREITKGLEFGESFFTGEKLPSYRVPIVGKLYGELNSPAAIQDKFYKNVVIMAEHNNTIKGMQARHENPLPYVKENPEARLASMATQVENQVSAIDKEKKELIKRGASQQIIDKKREQKTRIMDNFNNRVKQIQSQ